MGRKLLLTFLCICSFLTAYPQFVLRRQTLQPVAADSADIIRVSQKKPWLAFSTIFTINMGVWAFDRYVLDDEFAYIDIHTIKTNISTGFVWDNDRMSTNAFMHPYHGSLYFNSARSNGYNFWQSGVFALGGSVMWEVFLERELPSTNDLIATTVGGVTFGEITYRTSDIILDDTKRGTDRVGRELMALLVAPTRGLSRILTGDAWAVRSTSGRRYGIPTFSFEVSSGVRSLTLKDDPSDKWRGAIIGVGLEYGDKFDNSNTVPFNYFSFRAHLNMDINQGVIGQVNAIGRLWGTDAIDTKKHYLGLGVFQHLDYYDSDTISSASNRIPFKFSTPASFGLGLHYKSLLSKTWSFDSYSHLNAILLGASLSDHYVVDMRNYNFGSGFGWKLGTNIAYKDKIGLSWIYEGYRLYTWEGYPIGYDLSTALENKLDSQGDESNATFSFSSLKLDVQLKNQLYLTMLASGYWRSTNYRNFNNVRSFSTEKALMLTYKF